MVIMCGCLGEFDFPWIYEQCCWEEDSFYVNKNPWSFNKTRVKQYFFFILSIYSLILKVAMLTLFLLFHNRSLKLFTFYNWLIVQLWNCPKETANLVVEPISSPLATLFWDPSKFLNNKALNQNPQKLWKKESFN